LIIDNDDGFSLTLQTVSSRSVKTERDSNEDSDAEPTRPIRSFARLRRGRHVVEDETEDETPLSVAPAASAGYFGPCPVCGETLFAEDIYTYYNTCVSTAAPDASLALSNIVIEPATTSLPLPIPLIMKSGRWYKSRDDLGVLTAAFERWGDNVLPQSALSKLAQELNRPERLVTNWLSTQ
jgi:hypothetical protein